MSDRNFLLSQFRNPRYEILNKLRWQHFLEMGIPIAKKTVFEPGAGVGDQTEWLLLQGIKSIIVNDGRPDNLEIIKERFKGEPRVSTVLGNIETCLPSLDFHVDFIYFYGVYYHVHESLTDFHIMRQLAKLGDSIAFDFHSGDDRTTDYGYDNPSTSISRHGTVVTVKTMMNAMAKIWPFAYLPTRQLEWDDPVNRQEIRYVAVGSRSPINSAGLTQYKL